MVMTTNGNRRAREQQLRRLARRYGLWLETSRLRTSQAQGDGSYRLCNAPHTAVVYGGIPDEYSATLDDIERFVRPPLPEAPRPTSANDAGDRHDGW
jgi:hypothetical protein